jgi:hypothetical protein
MLGRPSHHRATSIVELEGDFFALAANDPCHRAAAIGGVGDVAIDRYHALGAVGLEEGRHRPTFGDATHLQSLVSPRHRIPAESVTHGVGRQLEGQRTSPSIMAAKVPVWPEVAPPVFTVATLGSVIVIQK